jgi:hypothetical protein
VVLRLGIGQGEQGPRPLSLMSPPSLRACWQMMLVGFARGDGG